MNRRRLLFCAGTVLILIAIGACMMVIGRGHTMYFDNKKLEYEGQTVEAVRRINVNVNGEQVAKLSKKDRGMTTFTGQTLKFNIEVIREKDGPSEFYDYTVKVPYGEDGIVLNLPGMIEGLPEAAYTSIFVPIVTESEEEDEEIITDEFGLGDEMGDVSAEG